MLTAFAYARVSTKEQAAKNNSIPEQLVRIERYAKEQDIQIIGTYQDSESAFHDQRPQFQQMVQEAIRVRPSFIIMDDSSRFARTRQTAIETKQTLRKYGMNVRFVNETYVDPKTITGLWMEGIQEIKNEATSREIAFHSWKGMSHNVQKRDPQTGWCYKNGGPAPYGYRIQYVNYGENLSGRPILKSYWGLDEETAPIVREVIVELYTKRQMSYQKIRDELNKRGIPSPKGGYWPTSTLVELLKENRLEQYAGTGFWNKESERDVVGQKYKPRDQWITVENAHPAIITAEELTAALTRKQVNRANAKYGAANESPYLLSGTNFESKPMFSCGHCGANVIGYGNSSVNWRRYVCGANRTKGEIACSSDWLVDATWLEQQVVLQIEERYTTPEKVDELVRDITQSVKTKNKELDDSISALSKQLKDYDVQITRLLDAIKSGVDPTLISSEVNALKQKKDTLESQIASQKLSYSKDNEIDVKAVRNFFTHFSTAYKNATNKEKRELIRTFVRHIELVPDTKEIRVEFYPDHTVQSIGAGEAPRYEILKMTMLV